MQVLGKWNEARPLSAIPGRRGIRASRTADLRRAEAILEERYMDVPFAELRMQ
jgi:hypothetical protein